MYLILEETVFDGVQRSAEGGNPGEVLLSAPLDFVRQVLEEVGASQGIDRGRNA